MHGFIRFIKSSRLLTVGAIAFIITLAAALSAFVCARLEFGVPWLPSGLQDRKSTRLNSSHRL